MLVLSDSGGSAGGRTLVGDALVLLGATGYALLNCSQEKLLVDTAPRELLAGVGGFGFLFACVQSVAYERSTLAVAAWNPAIALLVLLYGAALFCFYALVPHMLCESGSAVRPSSNRSAVKRARCDVLACR